MFYRDGFVADLCNFVDAITLIDGAAHGVVLDEPDHG
jgi:hypothetical protein